LTFADALTGSVLAAKQNAPLLLTTPGSLPEETSRIIREGKTSSFIILGGPASVEDKIVADLFPIINNHSIEGYTDQISYFPGQTIQFKVHAPNSLFSIDMIRYGKNEEVITSIPNIQGHPQNYFSDVYKTGAGWETTYQYSIPGNWQSGMYAAKLSDGTNQFYVTFIVKNNNPQKNDIAVLSSTNTWQAYNDWGGKSLYTYQMINGKPVYQDIVSFERPNPDANPNGNVGHTASGEKNILTWLEMKDYHYNLISDQDLHNDPKVLNPYKVLIISTHSEYWSTEMYNNLQAFLNRGGTLLYLSGNGVYWRAALKNGEMEVRKDGGNHTFINGRGGNFSAMGMTESSILGVRYQSTGFSVPAPYRVINPSHWIFSNTGLKKGELFGVKGLNTVNDSTGGASGWETDQMDNRSPKNTVLLAQGINSIGKGADMIYYDHPGGGGVFSTGSITFGGSLVIDPQLSRMVQNVIVRFNK
ncbi:MAG: N,N-dimethylformamidase beta subunit family domain-containing protein, partial [Methanobacterium sp.]